MSRKALNDRPPVAGMPETWATWRPLDMDQQQSTSLVCTYSTYTDPEYNCIVIYGLFIKIF